MLGLAAGNPIIGSLLAVPSTESGITSAGPPNATPRVSARDQLGDVHNRAAAEGHGEILEQRARDAGGRRRALDVDRRRDPLDNNARFDRCETQPQVYRQYQADGDLDARSLHAFESGMRRAEIVEAREERRETIQAPVVGRGDLRAANELQAADGHLHAGEHGARGIGDRATETGLLPTLGGDVGGGKHDE